MNLEASGSFDVEMKPESAPTDPVGRFSLNKQYHGDLEASSVGEMLGIRSDIEGSAGYVAMERVTGTLKGQSGSFALQHSGSMSASHLTLHIAVVPDSGTGALKGIAGEMSIEIAGGKHNYVFRYTLPQR